MLKEKINKIMVFVLVIAILPACGSLSSDTGENYGNILDSPDGLVLTEEEHIFGWGRSDCLICHNLNNIHQVNRTDINIDVEAIQEITFDQGESSCPVCHGNNGT